MTDKMTLSSLKNAIKRFIRYKDHPDTSDAPITAASEAAVIPEGTKEEDGQAIFSQHDSKQSAATRGEKNKHKPRRNSRYRYAGGGAPNTDRNTYRFYTSCGGGGGYGYSGTGGDSCGGGGGDGGGGGGGC